MRLFINLVVKYHTRKDGLNSSRNELNTSFTVNVVVYSIDTATNKQLVTGK